ncbi:hypothetical protein [Winogradskyella schleiferi]|uniref:hypothetical protein n=1 Tax=Winogradskyella schleiferi TaxID=2686078 RepID=UPI0015BA7645|nr:hypothetical protein [Winogradskyella schleiferi]
MTILKHPAFYVSISIASTLYVAQRLGLQLPNWMYFYINDFLCLPIVLSLCLAVLRLARKTEKLYVPFSVVLVLTAYFSIYFEWLMPKINPRYTFDVIDIGLYFLGAILFFRFQKILF